MVTDAIGNEIIIGATYGFSKIENAIINIKIGKVIALKDKSVTFKPEIHRKGCYGNVHSEENISSKKAISVYSCILFPIVG